MVCRIELPAAVSNLSFARCERRNEFGIQARKNKIPDRKGVTEPTDVSPH